MKKTIQPVKRTYGTHKRNRSFTILARLKGCFTKISGVFLAAGVVAFSPSAMGQGSVTYTDAETSISSTTALDVTVADGARLVLNSGEGALRPPDQGVLVGSGGDFADLTMEGVSVLQLFAQPPLVAGDSTNGSDERLYGLFSDSADSMILLGANTLFLELDAADTNQFDGSITNGINAGQSGKLLLSARAGTPIIDFNGPLNLNGINVAGATAPGAEMTFVVGSNVTANIAAGALSDGSLVQVDGTMNLLGAETLTDLLVTNGGAVVTGSVPRGVGAPPTVNDSPLTITDCLEVQAGGVLDLGGALSVANLKGNGTIDLNDNDICLFPSADQILGIQFEGAGDLLKFGDGKLTLSQAQNYKGGTWVGGGILELASTAQTSAIVISNDTNSLEAVGSSAGSGGIIYDDAEGNPLLNGIGGVEAKPGTTAPELIANAALNKALSIVVGSNQAQDVDGDSIADTATFTTTAGNIVADEAQLDVYNSGLVSLGGDEVVKDIDFTDSTAPGAEAFAGAVQGILTLGGVTRIDTIESATLGNGIVALGTHDLYLGDYDQNGVGTNFTYDGIFTGTADSDLLKVGDGELVLTQNSTGMNGEIYVQEGILDIRDGGALGTTVGSTFVQRGAELQLSGVTVSDDLYLAGFGISPSATGSITSLEGDNTVNGDVFIEGQTAFESTAGGTLTIAGNVDEPSPYPVADPGGFPDSGSTEVLFLAGAGNTVITGIIGNRIEELNKVGTGIADISGNDHQHSISTSIQDGVLRIDDVNNLGVAASSLAFTGDTNNAGEVPILDYAPAAGTNPTLGKDVTVDSSLAQSPYLDGTRDQALDVATFDIDDNDGTAGNSSLAIELDANGPGNTRVTIADTTSAIYKTGEDTLILNALNSTVAPNVAGEGTLPGDLLPVDVALGGVLNPAVGDVQVNGPGETNLDVHANCFGAIAGSSNFGVSGLGTLDLLNGVGGTASNGNLVLTGFDNLVVTQSTNTTFLGTINGSANFVYDGNGNVQKLGGVGLGFTGNFYVGNGRLVASDATSLGSFISDFDSQATFVCGTHQATASSVFNPAADRNFGILAVSDDSTLSENITLINDGHLVNEGGANSINTAVRLAYDATTDVLPGDAAYATIGSEAGTLTLQNGVFNETGTNVGLRLNTGTADRVAGATAPAVPHNGVLELGAIARDSVQDIIIGHADSTGTVVLLADNAHEGQTYLQGGTVEARSSGAFSAGNVIIDGASTLNGSTALGNDVQLNAELTTTSDNSDLRLDGMLSGAGSLVKQGTGTLTLAGNNLYTGSTTVAAGTLDSFNSLASQEIAVNGGILNARGTLAATDIDIAAGGALNTFGDELLANAAAVDVGGTLTLGGNETISELTGAATGAVEIGNNNLTASSGSFAGGINGSGDLAKDGNGTLTLSGTNGYTGETDILDGTLDVDGGSLASNEISVSNNATLKLQNGAQFAADSELVNDGLVEVTGQNEIGELFGSATGVIDIGNSASDELTVLGGVYDGDIVGGGSLVKDGSGSLVLNNGSSHTGATNVEAGSLRVGGALASNSIDISGGASLQTDRSELLADAASVNVDGTLSLGGDETIATLLGSNTGSIAVGDNTLAVTSGGSFAGALTGSGDLASSGDLTLTGASTLNGNLDVSGGTLILDGSINSTAVDVSTGAELTLSGVNSLVDNASVNVDGSLSLSDDETVGSLTASGFVTGPGTLTAATYDLNGAEISSSLGAGALTSNGETALFDTVGASTVHVVGGNLTLNGQELLANDAAVTLVGGGNLNLGGDETIGSLSGRGGVITATGEVLTVSSGNYDGTISGTGGLTKENEGTLSLSANQSYTGATNINGGTVQLDGTLASANVTVDGGTLLLNGSLASATNVTIDGGSIVLGSAERINDSATLTVRGNGLLVLNGDETVAIANLGTQSVTGTGDLIAGATTLAGTTLDTGLTSSGIVTTGTSGTVTTINAASSGSSLVVADETTLLLNAAFDTNSVAINGNGSNPEGVLTTGAGGLFNDTATVDVDGTLNLGGDETIASLSGADSGTVNLGAHRLTLDDSNGTFDGELTGTGDLVLLDGTLALTGESSLNGNLVVDGGTLNLSGSIDALDVYIDSDAQLNLSGANSLADEAAVNVDGILAVNDAETVGSLAATGTLNGAGTLTAESYDLDGATVDAKLGTGVLTSVGATALNGTSAATSVDVASGTLTLGSANRLDDNAAVNVDGTLVLNGSDTIASLDATGTISGSGTLTAADYNLDGAVASVNLGAGVLNSTGATSLDGSSAASEVNVIDGTLTLGGAQRLADSASVDVDGSLVLGGTETIGDLNGTGSVVAGGNDFTIANGGDFAGGIAGTGTLNSSGDLVLSGESAFSGDLDVTSGRLDLSGRLAASTVDVSSGATLALRGVDSLSDSAAVNVLGTLGVNDDETVGSLIARGTLDGSGTLTASSYDLTGAIVNANLGAGVLNSSGFTALNGTSSAGNVNVLGGSLTLGGAEALLDNAVVSLIGDLDLGGNETIGSLSGGGDVLTSSGETLTVSSGSYSGDISGAGSLAKNGSGTLTLSNGASYTGETAVNAGTLALNGALASSEIEVDSSATLRATAASLLANGAALTADGNVTVIDEVLGSLTGSGQLLATDLEIQGGQFDGRLDVNRLGIAGSFVSGGLLTVDTIDLGADSSSLTLNGAYNYDRLEGNGTVVADVLSNSFDSTIAPGGNSVGQISVDGSYAERGFYEADITSAGSDTIVVAGVVTIDTSSAILGVDDASGVTNALGSRVNVVNANGGIEGGYADITGNAVAQLIFDTGTGDVTSLGIDSFADLDENQLAIVNEILDSSIDGVNFDSTGDAGEILDTFVLNGGTDGLDDAVNSLSPEAYAGGLEHVMIATRRMAETVRSAPALVVVGANQPVMEELAGDAKGRSFRQAFDLPDNIALEIVGGYTGFSTGSDSSENGNDYDLQSQGGYGGIRMHTADGLLSAGTYVGFDGASVGSDNINLDGQGMVWGAYATVRPTQDRKLSIWSELAYGSYEYDATHSSAGGVSTGEVAASAFDFGLGASYLAFQRDGLSLSPSGGLRYVNGGQDSLSEIGGIGALDVDELSATSVLFDLGLEVGFVPTQNGKFGMTAYLGWQHDFSDTEREVSASFAGGESFSVTSPGLGSDALIYNIGAYYDFTDNVRIGASYQGEIRDQADTYQGFGLNGSIGF